MCSRSRRGDRGAAATELALLVPVVALLLSVVVGGARTWLARSAVEQAAGSAARAAALERGPGAAEKAARSAFRQNLRQRGTDCHNERLSIDTAGFAVSTGRPAAVTVRVECRVSLSDVMVPGLPGTLRVQATARAPLDTYRER